MNLSPKQIVHELDKHIIGQQEAKKAVAIALRNRYRRAQLSAELRDEITPKNIIMKGPTGVVKRRSHGGSQSSSARPSSRWRRPNTPKSVTSEKTLKAWCAIWWNAPSVSSKTKRRRRSPSRRRTSPKRKW